jgi:hypothetical protein
VHTFDIVRAESGVAVGELECVVVMKLRWSLRGIGQSGGIGLGDGPGRLLLFPHHPVLTSAFKWSEATGPEEIGSQVYALNYDLKCATLLYYNLENYKLTLPLTAIAHFFFHFSF